EFLAAEIADSRLLLLGTYRDINLSRQHPLSDTLGNLNRHPWFQRVRLSGLTLPETGRFIAAATGQAASEKLVSTVYAQTEGNALFLVEMARFLVGGGFLRGGGPSGPGGPRRRIGLRRIPEGVREIIGTRLNRLSKTCNLVLATASVIGRDFRRS